MATASGDPSQPLTVGTWAVDERNATNSERYLAKRLAAAVADYKGMAVTTFVIGAAAVGLAWLAVGVVAEHWLVPGGLPRWARWTWLVTAVVALASGVVRWIVPLVRYRVNLVYAARAIEREHPDLHNDLVNSVLVRSDEEGTSHRMIRSLKRRAARRLSSVPPDAAVVDRTVVMRLAYAVAVLVGVACLYEVLAPKSILTTASRLLAPWTATAAPSRVRIAPVEIRWRMPGDVVAPGGDQVPGHDIPIQADTATVVRGRQVIVAARLRGLLGGEKPTLAVMPLRDDGSSDPMAKPWQTVMVPGPVSGQGRTFVATLPDEARGLDHSLQFTISAGDAITDPVRVIAVDAASLLVRDVHYEYPAYTRQAAETVRWQGDIRAVEGTQVTLMAAGNRPLANAWIDFECDGKRDRSLKINTSDPTQASVSFGLRLHAAGNGAEHASYRLLFEPRGTTADAASGVIADALQHRIDVVPDLAPEVSIEEPRETPLRVPPDAPVRVRVRAVDPDYGLTRVALELRLRNGPTRPDIMLLDREKTGPFAGSSLLVPRQLGVEPGGTLEYRAVAVDTRPQRPNVSRTEWQALIVDPSAPPRPPDQRPDDGRIGKNGSEQSDSTPTQQPGSEPQEGDKQNESGKQPQDNSGAQQEKNDPPQAGSKSGQQQGQDQPSAQQKPGSEQEGQKQEGQKQEGGKQEGGKQEGGKQEGGKQEGGKQEGGKQEGGKQEGGKQEGGKQEGEGAAQGKRSGDKQSVGKQSGQKQADGTEQGDSKQPPRENVAADGTNDGEAMERILEHRKQQQGEPSNKQSSQPREQQDRPPCADANGKPCGKNGCSSCSGGSKPGGAAGSPQSGAESGQQGDSQSRGEAAGDGVKTGQGQGGGDKNKAGDGGERDGGGAGKASGQPAERQPGPQGQGKPGGDGGAGENSSQRDSKGSAPGGGKAGEKPVADEKGGGPDQEAGKQGDAGGQQRDGNQPPPDGDATAQDGRNTGNGASAGGDGTPRTDRDTLPENLQARDMEWGDENLAHARNAADLAIEHLRDSLAAGRTDVLEQLGWTPEQARAFIERWRAMRRMADSDDPRQRREFERAVRSLGLRPGGIRSSRDVPADIKGGQAEGRRSRPPSEYRDQVRAYLQGTSGE